MIHENLKYTFLIPFYFYFSVNYVEPCTFTVPVVKPNELARGVEEKV